MRPHPFALIVLFCSAPAVQSASRDDLGDPLPRHAIARLGTTRLRHQTAPTLGVWFAPDSSFLVIGGHGSEITCSDVQTGKTLRRLGQMPDRGDRYTLVRVAPDGKSVVTLGLLDSKIHRWDIQSGRETVSNRLVRGRRRASAMSHNGAVLAIVDEKGTLHVFDTKGPKQLWSQDLGAAQVQGLVLSPTGERLAVLGAKKMRAYQVKPKKQLATLDRTARAVLFHPDGRLCYREERDRRRYFFVLYDLQKGQATQSIQLRSLGREFDISPDGRLLAHAGKVYDLQTGEAVHDLPRPAYISHVRFSPDGKTLAAWFAAVNVRTAVRLWDVKTWKERCVYTGHQSAVSRMLLRADDGKLLASEERGAVLLWDLKTRKPVVVGGTHSALGASDDASLIVGTTHMSRTIRRLDSSRKTQGSDLFHLNARCDAAAVSDDGRWIAAGEGWSGRAKERRLVVFDTKAGKETWALSDTKGHVSDVAFMPGKPLVAYCTTARTLRVLDVARERTVWSLETPSGVARLAFSRDGKKLAVATGDWKLVVHDAANGAVLKTLEPERDKRAFEHSTRAMAWQPKSDRLVTGRLSGEVCLWDTLGGQLIHSWRAHPYGLSGLAVTRDGERLYTAGAADTTILVWDLPALLADAAKAASAPPANIALGQLIGRLNKLRGHTLPDLREGCRLVENAIRRCYQDEKPEPVRFVGAYYRYRKGPSPDVYILYACKLPDGRIWHIQHCLRIDGAEPKLGGWYTFVPGSDSEVRRHLTKFIDRELAIRERRKRRAEAPTAP